MGTFTAATVTLTEMLSLIRHVHIPTGTAAIFIGAPGTAKTESAVALVRELQNQMNDFGGCYFNLSNAQSPDISGLPKISNGPLTNYGVPLLFQPHRDFGLRGAYPALVDPDTDPYADDFNRKSLVPYPHGCAIFDEVGKLPDESVLASIAMLFGDGRTGQWGLPKGWAKIGFDNRQEDNTNTLELPSHTDNRVSKYYLQVQIEDYLPHWRRIGMHPSFRAFAAYRSGLVLSSQVPAEKIQFSSARSFTEAWKCTMAYCQNVLKFDDANEDARAEHVANGGMATDIPYEPILLPFIGDLDHKEFAVARRHFCAILAARCGDALAREFDDYMLHENERATMEDILADPKSALVSEHMGVLHSTVEMLIDQGKFAEHERIFTYVRRMPRAMASVYCVRFSDKWGPRAAQLAEFHELVAWSGSAAKMIYA